MSEVGGSPVPQTVRLEVVEQVATVWIERPDVRNAIDRPTAEALAAAFDRCDERSDVRAMVLAGKGPVFSAGMDLKAYGATGERPVSSRGLFGLIDRPPAKPVVAAVEGRCLGGGFEMALACDLIVAAEDAEFGLPEVQRGILAAGGGLVRLVRRIPRNVAMEVILAGVKLDARRACSLGLVCEVVPTGRAVEAAKEVAGRIAAAAPLATQASKQVVTTTEGMAEADAFEAQRPVVESVRSSQDAAEGVKSFLERRRPVWRGH